MRFAALLSALIVAGGAAHSRADDTQRADYLHGFDEGYRESYASSYVSSYNDGLWKGRREGYDAGFNAHYSALYDQAFERARPIGYERAYGAAFDQGLRLGTAVVEELQSRQSGNGSLTGADFSIWADNFVSGGSSGVFSSAGGGLRIPSPYDEGRNLGRSQGAAQGRQVGYDNGHGAFYARAEQIGYADASLQGPLDGARAGLDAGQRSGLGSGWRDGYVSAFGDAGPPGDRVPLMAALELPAIDEDRFLADVLGGDTLAGIRTGQVQGIDSLHVEELAAFSGTIDVPPLNDVPQVFASTPLPVATPVRIGGDSNLVISGGTFVSNWMGGSLTGGDYVAMSIYGYGISDDLSPAFMLSATAVPEPTTCVLAAFGLAAVAILARRRAA